MGVWAAKSRLKQALSLLQSQLCKAHQVEMSYGCLEELLPELPLALEMSWVS